MTAASAASQSQISFAEMGCKRVLAAFILAGSLCGCSVAKPKKADVLIVLDGFRHDYYR